MTASSVRWGTAVENGVFPDAVKKESMSPLARVWVGS